MDMSDNDRDMLIKTVMAEADRNNPAQQSAVAHVILNRIGNPQYGANASQVVLQPGQFESWRSSALSDPKNKNNPIKYTSRSKGYGDIAKIVDDAIAGGKDPTNGADMFQNPTIVNDRIARGVNSQGTAAPKDAQAIGSQVFWSSKKPQKLDQKDYADLLGDAPGTAQVAGSSAVPSGHSAVSREDYADLMEGSPAAPTQKPEEDRSGLFGELPHQIQQHPYIAGGLAAAAAVPVMALGGEVLGPTALALGALLRSRAVQMGTGMALGNAFSGHASDALHYLLRLSGMEPEATP